MSEGNPIQQSMGKGHHGYGSDLGGYLDSSAHALRLTEVAGARQPPHLAAQPITSPNCQASANRLRLQATWELGVPGMDHPLGADWLQVSFSSVAITSRKVHKQRPGNPTTSAFPRLALGAMLPRRTCSFLEAYRPSNSHVPGLPGTWREIRVQVLPPPEHHLVQLL